MTTIRRTGLVAGLVLAAGEGRRYGGPKALATLGGELFLDRAARMLAAGGCEPVVVVLGANVDEVRAAADLASVTVVVAPDWQDGMSVSLRAGLASVGSTEAAAVVIALVDQPWVGPGSVERLREAWEAGAVAAVATYDGKARHPVLFDRSVWADIATSAMGDSGARDWLSGHPESVSLVDCGDTGDPTDVDTPADLTARAAKAPG